MPRSRAPARHRPPKNPFSLLIESVKDYAIFMLDPAGYVASWNPGAQRLKGYEASEIIGAHFSTFYREEDRWKPGVELAGALNDGRYEDEGWRVRKDGSLFWANVVITAIRDATGEHVGFAKVTRDLTERRRQEQERIQLAEAQAALRVRDDFLSIASHELKTPIGALRLHLASLELLMRRRSPDPEEAKRLGLAIGQVKRVNVLVERLLDVSRISTGQLTLYPAEVSPVAILHAVRDEFEDIARNAGCELRVQTTAGEGELAVWDATRIQQVLGNLIINAVRYGPGKPVDVRLDLAGSIATFFVEDRGPGVPSADRLCIFERFQRGSNGGHQAGLGLGLYIAKQVVESHDGEIAVRDGHPDGGATFCVHLPLHPAALVPEPPRPER